VIAGSPDDHAEWPAGLVRIVRLCGDTLECHEDKVKSPLKKNLKKQNRRDP
jgi:hypothetical protein